MKTLRRVLAIVGVVILVGMYVTTIIVSLSSNPNSFHWLVASIVCTVVVPVFIWAVQLVYKLLKGDMEDVRRRTAESETDKKHT